MFRFVAFCSSLFSSLGYFDEVAGLGVFVAEHDVDVAGFVGQRLSIFMTLSLSDILALSFCSSCLLFVFSVSPLPRFSSSNWCMD